VCAWAGGAEPRRWPDVDDTRIAQLIRPRLTTVRVPMSEVGAAAVRLLVKRVEDPDAESTCLRLPTGLVVRESSRV